MKQSLEALRDSEKIHRAQLLALTKQYQLTIAEWQLLMNLADGHTTQEQLSAATTLDTSTLSRQLKSLGTKAMIDKEATGRDHRQLIYHVTEQGQQALTDINQGYEQLTATVFDKWTDEEKNLLQILLNRLETSLSRTNKNGVN
ncbi:MULTISPECIES: MarR family winged helix-turn-helix transcriptional regulator [Furfurilactobacillus]|uniref:HTH-type transcriptional regulator SarZ n=2 Tax=Furfurilactobacillus TaxID=2767882 RepID=A0A6N9I158_9LACO|nr:MarR family winged helix-turn-helix transcriptional regulator [Furfurilactobacillus milii]MYV05059.1 MarR family transcriptional regulator [Furfurilactobacillus milii]MYV16721.1 MarR family transcriptional regulator [Furfurilactobacillus milii]